MDLICNLPKILVFPIFGGQKLKILRKKRDSHFVDADILHLLTFANLKTLQNLTRRSCLNIGLILDENRV